MKYVNLGGIVISKGSSRRKQEITDKQLQDAWDRIFISKKKYEKAIEEIRKKKLSPEDEGDDDGYGNLLEKNNGKD